MRYIELFEIAYQRDLCSSQREASELLLERSPNYISQYRNADLSAEDGVRAWRKLVDLRDHELAARVLLSILDEGEND